MSYEEDNLLVDMVSESNEEVRNALYEKYLPTIDYMVKKYVRKAQKLGLDRKDLIQEANLAFTDAINNYNPDKDASLKTFITLCIDRRLINVINKFETKKNKIFKDTLSLDYNYDDVVFNDFIADESLDPFHKYQEKEMIEFIKKRAKLYLSNSEMQVFEYLAAGMKPSEITKKLDKNIKQIDNTIQRVRIKLRKLLEEE